MSSPRDFVYEDKCHCQSARVHWLCFEWGVFHRGHLSSVTTMTVVVISLLNILASETCVIERTDVVTGFVSNLSLEKWRLSRNGSLVTRQHCSTIYPSHFVIMFCLIFVRSQVDDELEIKAYYAGHVLGAGMFHIKVGQQSVVYTVCQTKVKPVYSDCPRETQKVVFVDSVPLVHVLMRNHFEGKQKMWSFVDRWSL